MNADGFKPPWNFIPLHAVRVGNYTVSFEVGLDQGDLMMYTVGLYRDGVLIVGGGGSSYWREMIPDYLDQIQFAKYLLENPDEE